MRAILAVLLAVVILFGGFVALSYEAQTVQPTVENGTNATQDAYNMTNQVYEGLGAAFSPAVVWMGVGVIVLLAAGFLVYVAGSGR